MNKNKCFEPLKKYGGYVQTWEEYEEVKQIIEENLHKEKSTDKIEVLTRWQDHTIEEKDKEIEKLNNIINELEKWLKEENMFDEYKDITYRETMGYVLDKLKELIGDK